MQQEICQSVYNLCHPFAHTDSQPWIENTYYYYIKIWQGGHSTEDELFNKQF